MQTKEDVIMPQPHMIRRLAGIGQTKEMIGATFDMLPKEFEKVLTKDKTLSKAFELGLLDLKRNVQEELWNIKSAPVTMLKARMYLSLEDPVLEAVAGNLIKVVLSKLDKGDRKSVGELMGL